MISVPLHASTGRRASVLRLICVHSFTDTKSEFEFEFLWNTKCILLDNFIGLFSYENPIESDFCLSANTSINSYVIESESDFPSLSTKDMSEEMTPITSNVESNGYLGQHLRQDFFDFDTKSVAINKGTEGLKTKLPIAVFMKKKIRKRKDRNLQ